MSAGGKFREQVTIYQPGILAQTQTGGWTTTTETSVTAWAMVEVLAAKETLENGRLSYKQPYRITLRYAGDITNVDRIVWENKTIAINSVVQDVRRTEQVLLGYGAD